MIKKHTVEFGDFQTPDELAAKIIKQVKKIFPCPSIIVEPTCGLGSFLHASIDEWRNTPSYYAFDINEEYIKKLKTELTEKQKCLIQLSDFFQKDWKVFFKQHKGKDVLIIGNPPWVTNTLLSSLKSNNLPKKSNFQGLKGFEAKTGKANFDIAEWMIIKLIESLGNSQACLAMLCKTSTARKVLKYFWNVEGIIHKSSIHKIDAKKYFDVSVGACLFITFIGNKTNEQNAHIYEDVSFDKPIGSWEMVEHKLVADMDAYNKYKVIEGNEYYTWRSGIKHDAAKVMELKYSENRYINGFNEIVDLEDKYIYPLLKSSDVANHRLVPQKFVIITQKKVNNETFDIKEKAPKTWAYLEKHSELLDNRKSIIYKKRPRFSIFGIGDYSFAPWKVVISSLYRNITFSVIKKNFGKPTMIDDTCYSIPCDSRAEATFVCKMLNSKACLSFLNSLIFTDSKRLINIDILKRIDILKLAIFNEEAELAKKYLDKKDIGLFAVMSLLHK